MDLFLAYLKSILWIRDSIAIDYQDFFAFLLSNIEEILRQIASRDELPILHLKVFSRKKCLQSRKEKRLPFLHDRTDVESIRIGREIISL